MICFKYDLNQDCVELQASNWCGLEQIFINGERVSRKLNFGPRSEHIVMLKDGKPARFQLLFDPITEELVCRIYKQNHFITSLKQGKNELSRSRQFIQHMMLLVGLLTVLMLYID